MQYSPGGGGTIFDFIVNIFNGSGCKLVGSLRNSALEAWHWKCLLLNSSKSREIHHRSTLCGFSMVMLKWLLLSKSSTPKLHPQPPPIWLAKIEFLYHVTQSPPCYCTKRLNFSIHLHTNFLQVFLKTSEITPIALINILIYFFFDVQPVFEGQEQNNMYRRKK